MTKYRILTLNNLSHRIAAINGVLSVRSIPADQQATQRERFEESAL